MYKKKYLKYKLKYLNAKKIYGGMEDGSLENIVEEHKKTKLHLENLEKSQDN